MEIGDGIEAGKPGSQEAGRLGGKEAGRLGGWEAESSMLKAEGIAQRAERRGF